MKKYIHINQHIIRRNKSNGYNEPVITVKTYKSNTYGHSVQIHGPSTVVYSPDKPLSCGARVWIETDAEVTVTDTSPAGSTKEVAWDSQEIICCRGSLMITARCRTGTWRAAGNFLIAWRPKRQKPQATSWFKKTCTNPVHVLKIDLTERYNYEYKRSIKTSGRFK